MGIAGALGCWLVVATPLAAHEVTYFGTVLAVEAARVHVKTIDEKTRAEDAVWFVVDKDTKVKRGDKTVRYADAKIMKGERIVLIVNHDASTKMLALEIRLAGVTSGVPAQAQDEPPAPAVGSLEEAEPPQDPQAPPPMDHSHMHMGATGWQFMQDGALFAVVNHQGGPRGGNGFTAPNWWMGMLSRQFSGSTLTFNTMLTLDPATVGKKGYREIFQVGEALGGVPLIDRQHPHDLFMQLAGIWRLPMGEGTGLTFAGGPAAEPAIGPVAFMHRASSAENPFAPLSHHTLDSTHVAYGVVTVAVDHGPWVVEGSVFNGREPDEHRWDFDFGRLDSVSGRVWFKPAAAWEFQVSTAHLRHPEELEAGDIQRTTVSGSWFKPDKSNADFAAVTVGYGLNVTSDAHRSALFGEVTRHAGRNSVFGRAELVQVETNLLLTDTTPLTPAAAARRNTVGAFTIGGVRDVVRWRGLDGGLGVALQVYAVPEPLQATHGAHPVSFQMFFRLRLPAGSMGRMWNMRMSQPMSGHAMSMDHQMKGSGGENDGE
jgi:hypothetical protein